MEAAASQRVKVLELEMANLRAESTRALEADAIKIKMMEEALRASEARNGTGTETPVALIGASMSKNSLSNPIACGSSVDKSRAVSRAGLGRFDLAKTESLQETLDELQSQGS